MYTINHKAITEIINRGKRIIKFAQLIQKKGEKRELRNRQVKQKTNRKMTNSNLTISTIMLNVTIQTSQLKGIIRLDKKDPTICCQQYKPTSNIKTQVDLKDGNIYILLTLIK